MSRRVTRRSPSSVPVPETHTCIFGKNTTEATNKLARRLDLRDGDVVLTTEMEHHSDDLPFRAGGAGGARRRRR